jgi:hypothetical protein
LEQKGLTLLLYHAGVNQYDTDEPPRYRNGTDLASRVNSLNPRWNEDESDERCNEQFQKAVELTGQDFLDSVDYIAKVGISSPVL